MARGFHARLLALLVGLLSSAAFAEDAKFTALFVFNFAKCVEWPTATGDFVFGILGKDPVADELREIAAKTKLEARTITVREFGDIESLEKCDIIYVAPGKSEALAKVLEKFGSGGSLVVTNKKGLAQQGAPINLGMVDGKQRYEINTESLKTSGLKVKPVLFKLGTAVGS